MTNIKQLATTLTPAGAQRMDRGMFPLASTASAADRSPPLSPPKSRAWLDNTNRWPHWPTDFGGTAVFGEATDGDGDENGYGEHSPTT